jgi:hypothetical protein
VVEGAGPDWDVTQGHGPGKGECAILTKRAVRGPIEFSTGIKLSDGGGKGRLHNPIYAPVVITTAPSGRRTLFTTAHLPAHIERLFRIALFALPTRTKMRLLLKTDLSPALRTYVKAVLTWKHEVMQLAAEYHVDDIIVGADWNLSAFQKWVRQLFKSFWPGLTLVRTKGPDLGKRNVGWLLTSMDCVDASVHKDPASDHRVGRFTLRHINPARKDQPKPVKPPDPFERCTYNGARMDQKTKTYAQCLEKDLGYSLTILQGCYNAGGVSASAGTHDGGGVLDLAPYDWERKQRAARNRGGFYWHRPTLPGVWSEHIHGGIRNHGKLSPAAARQQDDFDHYPTGKRDGLAGHRPDPDQFPAHPRAFDYAAAWHELHDAA